MQDPLGVGSSLSHQDLLYPIPCCSKLGYMLRTARTHRPLGVHTPLYLFRWLETSFFPTCRKTLCSLQETTGMTAPV